MILDDLVLNTIDPLPHDVYDYTHLIVIDFIKQTEKAVMIWVKQHRHSDADSFSGWIPKSVLRVDSNKDLWIADWWKEKEFS